jgi:hypothetical protein
MMINDLHDLEEVIIIPDLSFEECLRLNCEEITYQRDDQNIQGFHSIGIDLHNEERIDDDKATSHVLILTAVSDLRFPVQEL